MARSLTTAEGAVVRSLLASEPFSERERIRRSEVAPRTFRSVRKRALEEAWILDRYLPDPALVGKPYVSFLIAEPFIEHVAAVRKAWTEAPGIVHLWASGTTLFAVQLSDRARSGFPKVPELSDATALRRRERLTADARSSELPIYFDFEAAWDRLAALQGMLAYPHRWASATQPTPEVDPTAPSTRAMAAVESLVRRPFDLEARGANPAFSAPFFLPPSQQHALDRGWVERRVLLQPKTLSAIGEPRVESLVLVRGALRSGERAKDLLADLLEECRVTPFLFAHDGTSVLFGSLAPAPPAAIRGPSPRASVSAAVGAYLQGIETFRLPLDKLEAPVDHRYDRMLGTAVATEEAKAGKARPEASAAPA